MKTSLHKSDCGIFEGHGEGCSCNQAVVVDLPTGDSRKDRIRELEANRKTMIEYGTMKWREEDWHGVQDSASDLRDIDNELDGLRR